ncbi:MAG: cyclic nucleotide-gated ion channel/potassium channel family protein [Ferrovibrio sp.]|uniref:cyclic nucleotide-gated ion channel n=1 Tax=Ferrovibrio sp. TaxID=1917215 RepID=UPI0026088D21|nr:cyclic nucleotide-gated ion channel [Ferrovibrio sp.]MCW0234253.1 cyclic nucleotide-gated ion channel/potassium channel family protein [Ferrovibrio sp.]
MSHPGWRRRCFDLLADDRTDSGLGHRLVSSLILLGIAGCALAIILVTVPGLETRTGFWLDRVREATDILFTAEYLLRIWIAPDYIHGGRISMTTMRRRYMTSFLGVIDLLVILPFWINLVVPFPRDLFLTLEMFTLFKLARYLPGLGLVVGVLKRESSALGAALMTVGVLLVIASCIMYVLENETQPEVFGSIPQALWWGIVTVGSVGYGDMIPITPLGKLFNGFVIVLGVATFAIPAGLLASGFAEEFKRREFMVTWRAVAALPLFGELDASSIAEIASLLKPQVVPAGAVVVRKGDRAEAMFFIMAGEVEVEILPEPVVLGTGQHFGEIALLNRTDRTATVIAISTCRLLTLEVADFQRLLQVHPTIREHISSLAEQRAAQRKTAEGSAPPAV